MHVKIAAATANENVHGQIEKRKGMQIEKERDFLSAVQI